MNSPTAIYSLPDTEHFYQVKGSVNVIQPEEVYMNPGFIFAPFDTSGDHTYRINGTPEKTMLESLVTTQWKRNQRPVKRTSRSYYKSMFREAVNTINNSITKKIVISIREIEDTQITSICPFLQQLRDSYPAAFVYLFYIPGKELWIGASPELLLDTKYPFQRTTALAGTRKNSPRLEDWPKKERQEHRYVEQFIEEVLEKHDYRKEGPSPVAAGPVQHLRSNYFINIHGNAVKPLELHPGPALSGYPVSSAIKNILKIEPQSRRYYTGFLGPVWEEGHSRFYINLRCLEVLMDQLILYAGGGLTSNSDMEAEWMEIQDKLSTLRSKLHKG